MVNEKEKWCGSERKRAIEKKMKMKWNQNEMEK